MKKLLLSSTVIEEPEVVRKSINERIDGLHQNGNTSRAEGLTKQLFGTISWRYRFKSLM